MMTDERKIKRMLDRYGGYRERVRSDLYSAAADSLPMNVPESVTGKFEAERIRPMRAPGLESDVVVPFAWGIGSTLIICPLALYSLWALRSPWHWAIPITLGLSAITALVVLAFVRSTLHVTEYIKHSGPSGEPPEPAPAIEATHIARHPDGQIRTVRGTFRVNPASLYRWAEHAARGDSIAINRWSGNGQLFERTEYENLLATLGQMGLAQKGRGNKGWALTIEGQDYFTNFLTDFKDKLGRP